MIPYRDENQTQRRAVVTGAIIAANVLFWLVVQGAGSTVPLARSICELGLIPGELTGSLQPGTRFAVGEGLICTTKGGGQFSHIFTSMFLHGSWLHLIGNMWFLWLFGNNIEDSMGRLRFLFFYLICGVAAAAGQVFTSPGSAIPMVGASGAISGVMGGYLLLYPNVRVYTLIPIGFFITSMALPAWVMLGYWLLIQLVSGMFQKGDVGGVAFWAHVSGFAAGMILVKLFARPEYMAAHRAQHWRPRKVYGDF
jgi:membrane associated rhomboid family serine protease